MPKEIRFGVGCFNFSPIRDIPFVLKQDEYIESLRSALGKIPSIGAMDVEVIIPSEDTPITEPYQTIAASNEYLPGYDLDIIFWVHIPKRVQAELCAPANIISHPVNTEDFEVAIKSTYYGPVTFIRSATSTEDLEPSNYVVIVRRFLEDEFRNRGITDLRFEFLGPSPFHSDMLLRAGDDTDSTEGSQPTFSLHAETPPGYDRHTFTYRSDVFGDIESAYTSLIEEISSELSIFYFGKRTRVAGWHAWDSLELGLDDLIDEYMQRGFRASCRRTIHGTRSIDEFYVDLARYETDRMRDDLAIRHAIRTLDRHDRYFPSRLAEIAEDESPAPIEQATQIVNLLAARRTYRTGNAVTIAAGIIGAAIGAGATAVFGG